MPQLSPDRGKILLSREKGIEAAVSTNRKRIFLLSPANASGGNGKRLLGRTSKTDLAVRLQSSGVPLGECINSSVVCIFAASWSTPRDLRTLLQALRACISLLEQD